MLKRISTNLAVNFKFTQVNPVAIDQPSFTLKWTLTVQQKTAVVQLLTKLQPAVSELVYPCGRICPLQPGPAILSIQNCLKMEQGGVFNRKWTWSGLGTTCGGWAQLWRRQGHFGIRNIEYYLFKCHRDIRGLIKQSQDQTCRCVILYDPQELVWSKT